MVVVSRGTTLSSYTYVMDLKLFRYLVDISATAVHCLGFHYVGTSRLYSRKFISSLSPYPYDMDLILFRYLVEISVTAAVLRLLVRYIGT